MRSLPLQRSREVRRAFSIIELIFVIVVIGILASVALPHFASTFNVASVQKAKGVIVSVQSKIELLHNKNILRGASTPYPSEISRSGGTTTDSEIFADCTVDGSSVVLLTNPPLAKRKGGNWFKKAMNRFDYYIDDSIKVEFQYYPTASGTIKAGSFTCDKDDSDTGDYCKKMLQ